MNTIPEKDSWVRLLEPHRYAGKVAQVMINSKVDAKGRPGVAVEIHGKKEWVGAYLSEVEPSEDPTRETRKQLWGLSDPEN